MVGTRREQRSARGWRGVGTLVVVLLVLGGGLAHAPVAAASSMTIIVTTTADVVDPNDGLISLREAVAMASVAGHDDTIVLAAAATYEMTLCGSVGEGPGNGALLLRLASSVIFEGHGSTIQQTCPNGHGIVSSNVPTVLRETTIAGAQNGFMVTAASFVQTFLRLDHSTIADAKGNCVDLGLNNPVTLVMVFSRLDGCGSHGIKGDSGSQDFDIEDSEISGVSGGTGFTVVGRLVSFARSSIHDNTAPVYVFESLTMVGSHFDHNSGPLPAVIARGTVSATDSTFDDNTSVNPPNPTAYVAGLVVGGDGAVLTRTSVSRNRGPRAGLFVGGMTVLGVKFVGVVDSHVDGNIADGGVGVRQAAGIIVESDSTPPPALSLLRSTVSGNTGADNAGIYSTRPTTITDSTLAGNKITPGGTRNWTGAIAVPASLTMTGSTVSGNVVRSGGASPSAGGVLAAKATLNNDTIVQNSGDVGGVIVTEFGEMTHLTLADNLGSVARQLAATGDIGFSLSASVLSSPAGASGPSCGGSAPLKIQSQGYNFVSDATCDLFPPGGGTGDVSNGGDAHLAPLAETGGATRTRLPLPASALRDKIPTTIGLGLCAGADQRGVARPQGAGCDIGSVEAKGSQFHPLPPVRILDSRTTGVPGFSGPLVAGVPKALTVAGVGVPVTAASVVLNVTATGSTAGSYLNVWPAGAPQPTASSVNFGPGQTIPNLVTAKVGANGQVMFATNTGQTDVVVDLSGWFDDGTGDGLAAGDAWTGIDPVRVLDSRTSTGGWNGPLAADTPRALPISGVATIPAGATAIVANVTATGSNANSFLTLWPSSSPRPASSNLNFAAGETIANGVIIPVGGDGKIILATALGQTDVVVDVTGYFKYGTGSRFFAVSPTRVLDDRNDVGAIGPWQPNQTRAVTVTGGAIAANAAGVATNVTVTNGSVGSFLSVFPHATPKPSATSINFGPGQTIANQTMVRVAGGQVDIFNQLGTVDVIADIVGYYAA